MFEKKFLIPLLCLVVALSLSATATRGANILFVSSMSEDHMVGDDALKAFMEGLGHTVTYIDDDVDEAATEAAAIAADLVFISESCGSGNIKNEITELEVPMIVGEPWAWDEMGLTEGDGGDDPAVTTDVEIVAPGHYLAAGLSGTVAVLTDITSALGGCNLGKGITGPEATVIATATLSDGQTYDVIFVYEKGAALPVAPADGSAQVAADIRIGFGFHLYCDPVLNENAYALLGAAVDYALGLTGPVAGPVLKLDVGNSHNAEELEEGFTSFTLADSGSDVDGITIEFDGINSGDSRRRGEPSGVPYENIYRDFIFGRQSEAGVGLVTVTLSGLQANQTYLITLYSWDTNSTNIRIADWTANGEFLFSTIHDGNVNPPAAEDDYAYTGAATADANGVILMEAVPGEGTFAAEPFAFINALVLVPADPNLVGWWPLNEGSGDTAIDLSGRGNDGTIQNADAGGLGDGGSVWVDDPEHGMVISFNGDDSGAYVSTDLIIPFMSLDNDFTWAFWAKQHADQETNNDLILGNRYGGTGAPLQFIKFTPTRFEFFNDDYDYLEAVNYEPVPGDVWVYHVTVKDGTSLTYYRNGVEAGTSTITKTIDPNPFSMGGDATNVVEMWRGYLSDVRLYDRALSADEISQLAGKQVGPPTDGLVAYYPLENDVLDVSGNGNDGTIVGNPTYVEGPAGYGTAMEFDGESYVDCGNDASLDITGPFSGGIWIRPDTLGGPDSVAPLCKAGADQGWSWQLRFAWGSGGQDDIIGWQFNTPAGSTWIYVGQPLPVGEWYHIAASHDGETVKCYLDGVETDSAPMTAINSSPSSLLIGSEGWGFHWIGAIDEVVIYNRALSDSEIMYLAGN